MSNGIVPLGSVPPVVAQALSPARAGEFRSTLERAIQTVEGARQDAGREVDRFVSGEDEEVHRMVLATQRSELTFELFLQVRNKVVQAYQEVMRMQM